MFTKIGGIFSIPVITARPADPSNGMIHFNASENVIEAYINGTWANLSSAAGLGPSLESIDNLTTTADQMLYTTASDTWAATDITSFARTLVDDTDDITARATLGLGTVATKNTGVSNGQIPLMDAIGYPAADGSQITNIGGGGASRGYIDGLILSNNSTDSEHDIDISIGVARDDSDSVDMSLSSILIKQINAGWAVGTNQGGLDTGTVGASDWYHMWLIRRSDTGVVDVLFSESATAPSMPASYDQKRRIGAVRTDGSANIEPFMQTNDMFAFEDYFGDYSQTNPGTTSQIRTITVPDGIKVIAIHSVGIINGATTTSVFVTVNDPDMAANAPGSSQFQLWLGQADSSQAAELLISTDISAQIRTDISASGADVTIRGSTRGWIDPRGRDN